MGMGLASQYDPAGITGQGGRFEEFWINPAVGFDPNGQVLGKNDAFIDITWVTSPGNPIVLFKDYMVDNINFSSDMDTKDFKSMGNHFNQNISIPLGAKYSFKFSVPQSRIFYFLGNEVCLRLRVGQGEQLHPSGRSDSNYGN